MDYAALFGKKSTLSFTDFLKKKQGFPTQSPIVQPVNPPSKSPFNPNTPGHNEFNIQLDMRTNQNFWQKIKSLLGDTGSGIAQTASLVAGKESLPYKLGTGIYSALAQPSEGSKQVEQAGEVEKLPPVAKQIAQGAIRFFVPGVEKFATQIGTVIGSKGQELPSSLDAFMAGADASLTFGSIGAIKVMQDILGKTGDFLVNKNTTLRITPDELRVKLTNGEIQTPQGRQVARDLINKGLTLEAKGLEPRGGIAQTVGEKLGGEVKLPNPKIKVVQTNEPITATLNEKGFPTTNPLALKAPQTPKTAPETAITPKVGNIPDAEINKPTALTVAIPGGEKYYVKLTPKQKVQLFNENYSIPLAVGSGQPQIHLDPLDDKIIDGAKEITFQEFAKLTPQAQQVIEKIEYGSKTSGVAKSIEAKAIEQGLIDKGFDQLAEFNGTTFKEQADLMAKADVEDLKKIVRGEMPMPSEYRSAAVISTLEDIAKKTGDASLMADLANSDLASNISTGASELSLARMREKDSATMKLQEIKKAREARMEKTKSKELRKTAKSAKTETEKVNLSADEQSWDKFLEGIQC